MKQFDWVEFYKEFSNVLLKYKNNRAELLKKLLRVYLAIDITFPTIEQDGVAVDVDPFTVFGLLNKQITNDNRKTIINALKKEFLMESDIPENFNGIPVLNNLNATFYRFKDERHTNDIDNLWHFYELALAFADSQNVSTKKAFI